MSLIQTTPQRTPSPHPPSGEHAPQFGNLCYSYIKCTRKMMNKLTGDMLLQAVNTRTTTSVLPKSSQKVPSGPCRCGHAVLTSRTMFFFEHYFSTKSCETVLEAFRSVYPEKRYRVKQKRPTGSKISVQNKCLSVTSAPRTTKPLKLRLYRF